MASQVKTGTVCGIDTHDAQIKQAQAPAAPQQIGNVRFQVGSCYALPLRETSFDLVFCHALLEHVAIRSIIMTVDLMARCEANTDSQ